jgi:hypothetical protein
VRGLHGIKELIVLCGFHGDLGKEDSVGRKLSEALHQGKPLSADAFQFIDSRRVVLLFRQADVGKRHRIEVIVGQRDEAKAKASQLDDLFNYHVRRALPRTLTIGPPDRTE